MTYGEDWYSEILWNYNGYCTHESPYCVFDQQDCDATSPDRLSYCINRSGCAYLVVELPHMPDATGLKKLIDLDSGQSAVLKFVNARSEYAYNATIQGIWRVSYHGGGGNKYIVGGTLMKEEGNNYTTAWVPADFIVDEYGDYYPVIDLWMMGEDKHTLLENGEKMLFEVDDVDLSINYDTNSNISAIVVYGNAISKLGKPLGPLTGTVSQSYVDLDGLRYDSCSVSGSSYRCVVEDADLQAGLLNIRYFEEWNSSNGVLSGFSEDFIPILVDFVIDNSSVSDQRISLGQDVVLEFTSRNIGTLGITSAGYEISLYDYCTGELLKQENASSIYTVLKPQQSEDVSKTFTSTELDRQTKYYVSVTPYFVNPVGRKVSFEPEILEFEVGQIAVESSIYAGGQLKTPPITVDTGQTLTINTIAN